MTTDTAPRAITHSRTSTHAPNRRAFWPPVLHENHGPGHRSFLPGGVALADRRQRDGLGNVRKVTRPFCAFWLRGNLRDRSLAAVYRVRRSRQSVHGCVGGHRRRHAGLRDQNTADEFSHRDFLNAFLVKMHRQPVNLEASARLPSSPSRPFQTKRLTNLMHLNVDTSWYVRYRSSRQSRTFGDTSDRRSNIAQPAGRFRCRIKPILSRPDAGHCQHRCFHFAMIEQGGSSLYDALSLGCSSLSLCASSASIGGTEVAHFEIWNDKAGDAPPVDSGRRPGRSRT